MATRTATPRRRKKKEVPGARVGDRRIDQHAGREAALGLVFRAGVDDDEVQRKRGDGECTSVAGTGEPTNTIGDEEQEAP